MNLLQELFMASLSLGSVLDVPHLLIDSMFVLLTILTAG